MKTGMITFKLVRCFSFGFTIYSPKLNGFAMSIDVACFSVMLRSRRCTNLVLFENYWSAWND